jgi:hypothetical protein
MASGAYAGSLSLTVREGTLGDCHTALGVLTLPNAPFQPESRSNLLEQQIGTALRLISQSAV